MEDFGYLDNTRNDVVDLPATGDMSVPLWGGGSSGNPFADAGFYPNLPSGPSGDPNPFADPGFYPNFPFANGYSPNVINNNFDNTVPMFGAGSIGNPVADPGYYPRFNAPAPQAPKKKLTKGEEIAASQHEDMLRRLFAYLIV